VSDELPPLPDTRDPFELLGVAEDADERTLKRAYARLIRIYRPDEAPDEFARIHAAFEFARDAGELAVIEPARPAAEARVEAPLAERLIALVDAGHYDELFAVLGDPQLLQEAEHEPELAALLLRAAAVVVWRRRAAIATVRRLASAPCARSIESIVDVVEREVVVAERFHELGGPGRAHLPYSFTLPPPLLELIANRPLASRVGHARTMTALAAMIADGTLLYACDQLYVNARDLALELTGRMRGRIDAVPDDVRAAMDARLAEIEPRRERLRRQMTIAIVVAIVVAIAGALVIGVLAGELPAGTFAAGLICLMVLTGGVAASLPKADYREQLRRRFASMAADVGVPADTIAARIEESPDAEQLTRYVLELRADVGLGLFAMIATLVRQHEREQVE
jgi:hypothetical protein